MQIRYILQHCGHVYIYLFQMNIINSSITHTLIDAQEHISHTAYELVIAIVVPKVLISILMIQSTHNGPLINTVPLMCSGKLHSDWISVVSYASGTLVLM